LYEDQVWVPLIVKYPRTSQHDVVERTVSTIDIMPTILDVVGLSQPPGLQGRSLRAAADPDRLVFSESFQVSDVIEDSPPAQRLERAVYAGSLKLIQSSASPPELYRVLEDPREQSNLYAAGDGASQQLEAHLAQWIASAPAAVPQDVAGPDRGVVERLRSLGYIR
jgi:arylsulfatase A-like enzyme